MEGLWHLYQVLSVNIEKNPLVLLADEVEKEPFCSRPGCSILLNKACPHEKLAPELNWLEFYQNLTNVGVGK